MILRTFLETFLFGLSIIASIGAENSFLLREAIMGKHLVKLWLAATLIDVVFIYVSASSIGIVLTHNEYLFVGVTSIGVFFMFYLGLSFVKNSIKPKELVADKNHKAKSFKKTFLTLIGIMLFNGQMWIETIFVIGSTINAHAGDEKTSAYIGFYMASCIWFALIMFFGKALAPYFKRPILWRILDLVSGAIIIYIAFSVINNIHLIEHITTLIDNFNNVEELKEAS